MAQHHRRPVLIRNGGQGLFQQGDEVRFDDRKFGRWEIGKRNIGGPGELAGR